MEKAENDDEQELAAVDAKVTALRALKSEWDAAEKLKLTEIPSLQAQLSDLETKRSATVDSVESVSNQRMKSCLLFLLNSLEDLDT